MTVQFRRYEIKPGAMPDFVEWWRKIVPIRRRSGFTLLFAFELTEVGEYISAWEYHGGLAELERAYYADPDRAALAQRALEWARKYELARNGGDHEAAADAIATHPGFSSGTHICTARPIALDQSRIDSMVTATREVSAREETEQP